MKVLAIVQLTFRESWAKKTFIAFFAISTLTCLLFIFALNLDIVDGAQSSISLFGIETQQLVEIREVIFVIEGVVAVLLFTGGIFMSLFATSNLISTLLQPGFIDLFISKPLHRFEILTGRITGAVSIVAFNVFYLILFSWIIMSLKTGLWNWGFLAAGIMIILTFIILFSLMTLLSILSGSGPFSLMLTYLILFFSPLLIERNKIYALLTSKVYGYLVDGLYYFLPKTAELGSLTGQLVRGIPVSSWMPLWSSLLFALFMFTLSAYVFSKKNF